MIKYREVNQSDHIVRDIISIYYMKSLNIFQLREHDGAVDHTPFSRHFLLIGPLSL